MINKFPAGKKKDISLLEFSRMFDTQEKCLDYIREIRWKDGIFCPRCGGKDFYKCKAKYDRRKCANCAKNVSPISGTIFMNTKIELPVWFFIMYSAAINKKSVGSRQSARNLGITQKTAWTICMKLRAIYKEPEIVRLSGIVEIDECFLANGLKWKKWGGVNGRKLPILGMIERNGKVVTQLLNDRNRKSIEEIVLRHIETGSTVYTDGHLSYRNLDIYYNHQSVIHSDQEYVRGNVHTNNIENFWMFLKKAVKGAHHSVSRHHVQKYCDELTYRFNTRGMTGWERFSDMFKRAVFVKAATYDEMSAIKKKEVLNEMA